MKLTNIALGLCVVFLSLGCEKEKYLGTEFETIFSDFATNESPEDMALNADGDLIYAATIDNDMQLGKISKEGTLLWRLQLGNPSFVETPSAVAIGQDGKIYLAFTSEAGTSNADMGLAVFQPDGTTISYERYHLPYAQGAGDIHLASNGNIYICGETTTQSSGLDAWLAIINANGDLVSTHTYGGSSTDATGRLVAKGNDRLLLYGLTYSFGAGDRDFWLIEVGLDGVEHRRLTFGTPAYDEAQDIIRLSDGGYLLVGHSAHIDPDHDTYVVRLGADLQMVSSNHYGGGGHNGGESAAQTSNGDISIAGRSSTGAHHAGGQRGHLLKTSLQGTLISENYYTGATTIHSSGFADAEFQKMLVDGNYLWLLGSVANIGGNRGIWVKRMEF